VEGICVIRDGIIKKCALTGMEAIENLYPVRIFLLVSRGYFPQLRPRQ
jgi:hypothetical protein